MARRLIAATLLIWLMAALAGCGVLIPVPRASSANDPVNTAAAQTVSALGTKIFAGGNVTLVPLKTGTLTPTSTATITLTPKTPEANTNPSDCTNLATFIRDVTIPDGSIIPPNTTFTKTWELQNNGTCTWNSGYDLIFTNQGNSMSGQTGKPIRNGNDVTRPGEKVQISVTLRAPNELGDFEGRWMLRDDHDRSFGLGQSGAAPFFVKIHVAEEYSFADFLCSAEWSSNAGKLDCPGKDGDSRGFVLPLSNPTMEDNVQREGPGWLSMPQPVAGGFIVGKFPAVVVPSHTDFRTTISCAPGTDGCYVHFKITYRIDNGGEQLLGEWNEGFEGGVTDVVKDLDMVSGKSTAFYFYVSVTGTPSQSRALWFQPRIIKN